MIQWVVIVHQYGSPEMSYPCKDEEHARRLFNAFQGVDALCTKLRCITTIDIKHRHGNQG